MARKMALLDQIQPQIPDVGRIRAGYQADLPKKSGSVQHPTWIITAQTTENLERLQADPQVGGKIEPWEDDSTDHKFRLWTETDQLHVVLHPNSLPNATHQRWEGQKLRRRCNGEVCTSWPLDPEAAEAAYRQRFPNRAVPEFDQGPVEIPCVCNDIDDEKKHCSIRQHLGVILPQCTVGQFRLVTSSIHAVSELKASVQIVRLASAVDLPRAVLTRVYRRSGEKRFRVPTLTTAATFDQIEAAAAARGALVTGQPVAVQIGSGAEPRMALPAGAVTTSIDDDLTGPVDQMGPAPLAGSEPIDAEVIEIRPGASSPEPPDPEEVLSELGYGPGDPPAGMSEVEADEARELMAKMKATSPKEPEKDARKPRKATKKKAGSKARKKPAASPGGSAGLSEDQETQIRDSLRLAWLAFEDQDSEAMESVLQAAGLWPLESIPVDRLREAADLVVPVYEAAEQAGRLPREEP